jgi:hypothetical protein
MIKLVILIFILCFTQNTFAKENESFVNSIIKNQSFGLGLASANGSHLGYNFELDIYNIFVGGSFSLDGKDIDQQIVTTTNRVEYTHDSYTDLYLGYNYYINKDFSVTGGFGISSYGGNISDLEIQTGQIYDRGKWSKSEIIYFLGARYYFDSFYLYGSLNSMIGGNLGIGISFGRLFENLKKK